jgi:hypothetical protein
MHGLRILWRGYSRPAILILGCLLATSGCGNDSPVASPKPEPPTNSIKPSSSEVTTKSKPRRGLPAPDAADLEGRAGRPRGR